MMLGTFRKLFGGDERPAQDAPAVREPAPREINLDGSTSFALQDHLSFDNGFPFLNWEAARQWIDSLPSDELKRWGWDACERGWLLHMRDALGAHYRLNDLGNAVLVSALEAGPARAALDFMQRASKRIASILDGIAEVPEWGSDILIVFDDQDDYYHYVSHYYPEGGEYSTSGGMCLSGDCVHFVTAKADFQSIEPVIAHELTHSMLAHLPLPLWLNEGLAVNTEQRIITARPDFERQREIAAKHGTFWGEAEIQEFWSGASFFRPDDGNALSYDLAQGMVKQMARDWGAFQQFVRAADAADAGHKAAQDHLNLDLGAFIAALLGRPEADKLTPDPTRWPERI